MEQIEDFEILREANSQEKWKKYQLNDIELIDLLDEEKFAQQAIVTKTIENSSVENSSDNVHALVLYKDMKKKLLLAYITKHIEPYKESSKFQYKACLKKIEAPLLSNISDPIVREIKVFNEANREYIDAVFNGSKIIYTAKDRRGSFLAIMKPNGENDKVLKCWNVNLKVSRFIAGKKYILVQLGYEDYENDGIIWCERISMDGKSETIGKILYKKLHLGMMQRFWEMSQGFFSIDYDHNTKGIVVSELLNTKTQIKTYKLPIIDYGSGTRGHKLYSVYGDSDTERIYFFLEPAYNYSNKNEGQGYFYYLDINKKEICRAVDQKVLLANDNRDFVVKDNKIIYFNSDEKNGKNKLTVLYMKSGIRKYLWEEIDCIKSYQFGKSLNLIGDYLYFIKGNSDQVKANDICRIKIDGSEKTIIEKVDESITLQEIVKICSQ